MTILVLDGHSRAALETMQSLGRLGFAVDIAAESADCLAFRSSYAARKLQQPGSDQLPGFHAWLRAQDRERNYALIVPATELSLLALRALDEDDPLRRKAVMAGNAAMDVALDKEKTWALAQQLGVPVPQSRLISSVADIGQAPPFPVVLKPTHSKIPVDGEIRTLAVAVVKDEAQRQSQLLRWLPFTPVLQQQYVSGGGVGAEFLFDRGNKVWHFVHARVHEYPLTGGASSYRRAIQPPVRLLQDAEKLLTALQWHGVAMVEFKMDGDGRYWLMEINPRLWGSLAVSIDAGVNFPIGLLQIACGQQPGPQPAYKQHYTRDLLTDMEWFKDNLRADHQDPLLLTRSRSFSFFELLRPLTGRESWDHFDWRDLGVTRRIVSLAISRQLRPILRKAKEKFDERRWMRHHRRLLRRLKSSGQPRKIVFLCYGNICRSPLAAGLAEQSLAGIEIESAGFHDHRGRTSPEKILRVARSFGIDLAGHRSARVNREQLERADLIIAMDMENMARLKNEFPESLSRTTLLGLFADPATVAIDDPYQADDAATNHACAVVRSGVKGLCLWLDAAKAMSCAVEATPATPRAN
ncbi:MAG TPA: ATP-grasp domain-containing protein [Candidatus Angelobacter sp.]|nr:ATP-grasp domain-containing protein [Candidatus Angelobacter sp.]